MSTLVQVKQFPLEEEYKKKTGVTPSDITRLRAWLNTQPHLPGDLITDLELILAYHSCGRSTEVTKQVIDLNITLKSLFGIFKDRIVDDKLLKTLDVVLAMPLEQRCSDGSVIIYARLIDYNVKNFVFCDIVKAVLMTVDLWQYEDGTWPGGVLIVDLDGLGISHLPKLDLTTVQQLLYYLQKAILVKIRNIHFMSAPSFMDKLMMILKPFMDKAFLDLIHIHPVGSHTIEKFIPIDGLPKDAGGKYKTLEQGKDEQKARFKANASFFERENQKQVTEARRPGRPKTISDIFGGIEGSFKKLDID